MAVATQREYGLFIDGALVEPASGEVRELREPATAVDASVRLVRWLVDRFEVEE